MVCYVRVRRAGHTIDSHGWAEGMELQKKFWDLSMKGKTK